MSPQEKKARVDRLIEQLALQACRNTTIGSSLDRGVSGGEVRLLLYNLLHAQDFWAEAVQLLMECTVALE